MPSSITMRISVYIFYCLTCFTGWLPASASASASPPSHTCLRFTTSEKLDAGLVCSVCKLKVEYKQGESYQQIAKVFACLLAGYFVLQCWGSNPGPCGARWTLYHWAASQPCKLQFKHREHFPSFTSSLPPLFIPQAENLHNSCLHVGLGCLLEGKLFSPLIIV